MKSTYYSSLLAYLLLISIYSCKSSKNSSRDKQVYLSEVRIDGNEPNTNYRASYTKSFDLIHTSLDVRFDWAKQYLYGKATLSLHPHFYPSQKVVLNAQGMEVLRVARIVNTDTIPLNYQYKLDSLSIMLEKKYNNTDTLKLFIDYIAKPEELGTEREAEAISERKGLYFINPLNADRSKPQQIWTQGETESNSVWFPTIDGPNQKMTQEIKITIDSSFVTLSNGLLISSFKNNDGTRSDLWQQKLPHAPYLTMMAIGKYKVVKDYWKNKDVFYYVEPAYENVARKIFGKTPEMLSFFSDKLGVDYPWEKYSQVVVRDFVSGAMENTSATVHGEFIQRDERELLDENYEDFIAHELFHHWFGDLLTCESWSNIPLNESFATYGEYLWSEYKYGKDVADASLQSNLTTYLSSAKTNQVDLIRYKYASEIDLYDRNSYDKGARVLHMLRKYVGDDAFFESLKLYLNTYRFKTVEVDQLRLAFEEVSGEDLNWFFDQWFFASGHPQLTFAYGYDEGLKQVTIDVSQNQNLANTPLYKLPITVDIYTGSEIISKNIIISKKSEAFTFEVPTKPLLVNVDAEKMLLCTKRDLHEMEEWIYLYKHGKLFMDRYEAIKAIGSNYNTNSNEAKVIVEALDDVNKNVRLLALRQLDPFVNSKDASFMKSKLVQIATLDKEASVRDAALSLLDANFNGGDIDSVLKICIYDSSYAVMSTAVFSLVRRDSTAALNILKQLENDQSRSAILLFSKVYCKYGSDEQYQVMAKVVDNSSFYDRSDAIQEFGEFMLKCNDKVNISQGVELLKGIGLNDPSWRNRLIATNGLLNLKNKYYNLSKSTTASDEVKSIYVNLKDTINEVVISEKDESLKKLYSDIKN
jgi:aminopeptidase N